MTTQLMLTALFSIAGIYALGVISASLRSVMPRLAKLRQAAEHGSPQHSISWRVTTIDVARAPAQVRMLPVRSKAVPARSQSWRAAA
jgi:hypothetical protein